MRRGRLSRCAVYRLFDKTDRLLYVGVGELPATRWQDHRAHKNWWPEVHHATVFWFESHDEAYAEEARAIASEKPVYNHSGTPRERRLTPGPRIASQACDLAAIAARLGVGRPRANQIVKKADFPAPSQVLAMGKVWEAADVERWIATHRPDASAES